MTRLLVSQAEFDGAVRLLTAEIARTDPEGAERRALAAVELLYRAPGPSPAAATPRVVVGDTQTPSALRIDAAAGGDGAPVGCLPPDPRPAAPQQTTEQRTHR